MKVCMYGNLTVCVTDSDKDRKRQRYREKELRFGASCYPQQASLLHQGSYRGTSLIRNEVPLNVRIQGYLAHKKKPTS